MSIASEITRLQTAKADLKASINAKTDAQHQITNETIDEYADFVDSISGGSSTIDVGAEKLKFAQSDFTSIPNYLDFSNVTDFSFMFNYCERMTTVRSIDTSNGTNFSHMFANCSNRNLTTIPTLNTSKGTDLWSMFESCWGLTTGPAIDTSNATNVQNLFGSCLALTTLPEYDYGKVNNIGTYSFSQDTALTTLGGFKDLGKNYSTSVLANNYAYVLNLSYSPNLTYASLMNVINKVYDIATKGCKAQKLVLGSTNLAKLTAEEISTATNKGWSIS